MEVNNLEKAKKLCAELDKLKIQHYHMAQFPADKASAKIVVTSGDKEMIIPIEVQPLTASELMILATNRMEVKMEKLKREIELL